MDQIKVDDFFLKKKRVGRMHREYLIRVVSEPYILTWQILVLTDNDPYETAFEYLTAYYLIYTLPG